MYPSMDVSFFLLRDARYGKIAPADAQAELERLSKINTNWYDEVFKLAHTPELYCQPVGRI